MIKHLSLILALVATSAQAEEAGPFSEGSKARSWGLTGEETAIFTAKVVDVLCEVAGDCPDNCGDGKRQLGLVREVDNVLVMPTKNGQPAFTGASVELAPYCGKVIEVDGLFAGGEEVYEGAPKVYQIQRLREEGGDWKKANRWTKDWAKKNPKSKGKGPWYRRDPRIKSEIEKDGYLGLGPEEDILFIKDWY